MKSGVIAHTAQTCEQLTQERPCSTHSSKRTIFRPSLNTHTHTLLRNNFCTAKADKMIQIQIGVWILSWAKHLSPWKWNWKSHIWNWKSRLTGPFKSFYTLITVILSRLCCTLNEINHIVAGRMNRFPNKDSHEKGDITKKSVRVKNQFCTFIGSTRGS